MRRIYETFLAGLSIAYIVFRATTGVEGLHDDWWLVLCDWCAVAAFLIPAILLERAAVRVRDGISSDEVTPTVVVANVVSAAAAIPFSYLVLVVCIVLIIPDQWRGTGTGVGPGSIDVWDIVVRAQRISFSPSGWWVADVLHDLTKQATIMIPFALISFCIKSIVYRLMLSHDICLNRWRVLLRLTCAETFLFIFLRAMILAHL